MAGSKLGSVLVGGGTGFIGSVLCRSLDRLGYVPIAVSRTAGARRLTWNELRKDGLPPNCVAVVNTAGANVFNNRKRWDEDFKEEVVSSRTSTTRMLAIAIERSEVKPKVFVSMSGVGFYKPDPVKEYTEESSGGDFDFLSKLTVAWEKNAELSERSADTRQVIIRSGIVLGRQGGVIKDMFWPFFMGVGGPVGSGKQPFPWIHVHDVVGLILFAIENPKVRGILNGVAPQIITSREFATAFGRALHRPSLFPLPTAVLNLIFSPERAKIMTEGQKVLPKRVLDYGFHYDFPDINSACHACAHTAYEADEYPFF